MNILITGGTGFIGKQIAIKILELGTISFDGQAAQTIDKVILFDAFAGEELPQDPKIQVITGDITDKSLVENHRKYRCGLAFGGCRKFRS